MCFLKHLQELPQHQTIFNKQCYEQSSNAQSEQHQIKQVSVPQINIPYFNFSYLGNLSKLIMMIDFNNHLISNIQQKINSLFQGEEIEKVELPQVMEDVPQKICKDEVLCKLFNDLPMNYGENSFKYKLSLEANLPSKLYKNRKFSISIKLMPSTARSSKIVINSNPLNVCIGVFDKDGNWVHENICGEPIFNGLTQVDLYQGKAQFPRLLLNEISSNLPKQKLNLAIYVKPGRDVVLGDSQNGQNCLNWKSVKPLILKNVVVLSKKRKKISEDLD